jgi:ATP-dependent Clp protease ATP-binding subunit ClpA
MKILSSLDLVVILAANETIAARRKEIEPEHFFCALLKFSESDEQKLQLTVKDRQLIDILITERDKVREVLKDYPFDTTKVRRQLRKVLGYGNYQYKGGIIHRSKESRQLFMKAIMAAQKKSEKLNSAHLLKILLEEPTDAMKQVIEDKIFIERKREKIGPETLEGLPLLSKYSEDITQYVKSRTIYVSDNNLPQIQVLTHTLRTDDKDPILLICVPEVQANPIILNSAQELINKRILEINFNKMYTDTKDNDKFADLMADLLSESFDMKNFILFIDTLKQENKTPLLLNVLKQDLLDNKQKFIIAVSEKNYRNIIETDQTFFGIFKIIWLHKLKKGDFYSEL